MADRILNSNHYALVQALDVHVFFAKAIPRKLADDLPVFQHKVRRLGPEQTMSCGRGHPYPKLSRHMARSLLLRKHFCLLAFPMRAMNLNHVSSMKPLEPFSEPNLVSSILLAYHSRNPQASILCHQGV